MAQSDREEGRRSDGPTTAERDELRRLRRELRQVKLERDILAIRVDENTNNRLFRVGTQDDLVTALGLATQRGWPRAEVW